MPGSEESNEFTVTVSPTADFGASPDGPKNRKSLSVVHRPGLSGAEQALSWFEQTTGAKTRGPAVRPQSEESD
ncbi:hypothetical protein ADL01_36045 [Streptomyces sp. NRRL WC-3618]|jgi:hypothetical protein|uniref:hypothetical protein n=1 Tax=Streptomyces sp. NRRL WC-3618 TaxID=1519490 RepID=UPI0006B01B03|nr:hypothetical protein [Streptomyces sp. NRRL WC-3618]KOV59420.1 hypothetical protein ADL01_36045 [Streptomyces sp. NRRL WC-3618]